MNMKIQALAIEESSGLGLVRLVAGKLVIATARSDDHEKIEWFKRICRAVEASGDEGSVSD